MDNVPIKERATMKVAEDLTVDDYDKVPISNFGMNLMKMMGFS